MFIPTLQRTVCKSQQSTVLPVGFYILNVSMWKRVMWSRASKWAFLTVLLWFLACLSYSFMLYLENGLKVFLKVLILLNYIVLIFMVTISAFVLYYTWASEGAVCIDYSRETSYSVWSWLLSWSIAWIALWRFGQNTQFLSLLSAFQEMFFLLTKNVTHILGEGC